MLKKLFIFILPALFFCISCKKPGYGSLSVSLKDGPSTYEEINIDLQGAEVLLEAAGASGWYKLKANPGIYNLLFFQNTALYLASGARLPVGKILQVRLLLGRENSVKESDTYHPLNLPFSPDGKFSLTVPADFNMTENGTLHIVLDIDGERSVIKTGRNKFVLDPVAVSGTVRSPLDIY